VASVEGVTDVPAEESDSPSAETPGAAAVGPTLMTVTGAGALAAVAAVAGEGAIAVEAGAVPVGVGWGESEVAGAVPDGVRMSDVAVVGAEKMFDAGVLAAVPAVELPAVAVPPGVGVELPM